MRIPEGKLQNITFDGNTSEVLIRKRAFNRIIGPFSAIGPLTNRKRQRGNMQAQDIFDVLDKVSKGAFSVFNNLKFNRDEETNLTQYACPEEMTKTDKEVLSRRLRELKDVDLIRSLKKEIPIPGSNQIYHFQDPRKSFIINPNLIRCSKHAEALHLWQACAATKHKG